MFGNYFTMGLEHILDLQGYDHILFIVVMCCVYHPREWKKLLLLATAFTLGHSLTLVLSVLGWVRMDADFIEFLIPLTIFLTALHNIWQFRQTDGQPADFRWVYPLVFAFGLVHGMGFSNYLRMMMGGADLTIPLLGFNLGVEAGQVVIVALFILSAYIVLEILSLGMRYWVLGLSVFAAALSFSMMW